MFPFRWLLSAFVLGFAFFIIMRYSLPWLLGKFQSSVRFTSISPVSIRGIRLNRGGLTITIERVGFSFHSPTNSIAKHVHIQIQGLVVIIAERTPVPLPVPPIPPQNLTRSRLGLLNPSVLLGFSLLDALFFSWFNIFLRPLLRRFFVGAMRKIIDILPHLMRLLDFEIDRAIISHEGSVQAHISIQGVTLATKVELSKSDPELHYIPVETEELPGRRQKRFYQMTAGWRDQLIASSRRVFSRAWLGTSGSLTFGFKIDEFTLNDGLPTVSSKFSSQDTSAMFSAAAAPPQSPSAWSFTSTGSKLANESLVPEAAIAMPMPAKLRFSFAFSPSGVEDHSLAVSFSVPTIHISSNSLLSIANRWSRAERRSDVHSPLMINSPSSPGEPSGDGSYFSVKPRRSYEPKSGSEAKRKRVQNRHTSRVLKSLEFKLSSLRVSHTFEHVPPDPRTVLSSLAQGMFVTVRLSDPDQNAMHRNWIGRTKKPSSKLDASVFSISCGLSAMEVHRMSHLPTISQSIQLANVGTSGIDMIATQWEVIGLPKSDLFAEDYNSAQVVLEVRSEHIHLTERIKDIKTTMDLLLLELPHSKETWDITEPSVVSTSSRSVVAHYFPRVVLDAVVTDIRIKLQCGDGIDASNSSAFDIDLVAERVEGHVSACFEEPAFTFDGEAKPEPGTKTGGAPLCFQYDGWVVLAPLEAFMVFDSDSQKSGEEQDVGKRRSDDLFAESLDISDGYIHIPPSPPFVSPKLKPAAVAIIGLEADLSGRVLGWPNPELVHYFTMDDLLTEVTVRADKLTLDLRNPAIIPSFLGLLPTLNAPRSSHPSSSLTSKFGPGVIFYCWIGAVQAALTEHDINPRLDATKTLVRGVALQSAFVFEYCYLVAPQSTSTSTERGAKPPSSTLGAGARLRLGLQKEDLYLEAVSRSIDPGNQAAILRLELVRSRFWTFASTCNNVTGFPPCPSDSHSADGTVRMEENIFLDLPSLTVQVPIIRGVSTRGAFSEKIQIMMASPRLYWRFQLSLIYSILLVLRQFQRNVEPTPLRPHGADKSFSSQVSFKLNINDVHGLCIFPSSARAYSRIIGLGVDRQAESKIRITSQSMRIWVPSAQSYLEGKWEELLRSKRIDFGVDMILPRRSALDVSIDCSLDTTRLRIPYKYNLHSLISGVVVAMKAIKHLRHDVATGIVTETVLPTSEEARILPRIRVRVKSLNLEAADDPFEGRLNLIWRTGLGEQRSRLERALAFDAKVAAIHNTGQGQTSHRKAGFEWHFHQSHTVEPSEAWSRLLQYNSDSWVRRFKAAVAEQIRREDAHLRYSEDPSRLPSWITIDIFPTQKVVPLFRATFTELSVAIGPTSFDHGTRLRSFMSEVGSGLPHSTLFTLLVPFRVRWTSDSIRFSIRDYPLPIVSIPSRGGVDEDPSWQFETDMVIGEELGPPESVLFEPCVICEQDDRLGTPVFEIQIPKTIMPVKSYAHPVITVTTPGTTDFTWGVSLTPMVADVMRVVDTITPPPRDFSPALGFWDKLRLIFHWRLKATFSGDVHIHLKGTRDPYVIDGRGAGFLMEWKGNPTFTVGLSDQDQELLQLHGTQMLLVIPDLKHLSGIAAVGLSNATGEGNLSCQDSSEPHIPTPRLTKGKVVAKFNNGVRMGMGFLFERSIDGSYNGQISEEVRVFRLRPHYEVKLRRSKNQDSYVGFRSRYIHCAISLASAARTKEMRERNDRDAAYNIFHLSPKAFTHFWSWWDLFKSPLSLPIRQGALFPSARPPSLKFSKHLATIKYRITLEPLLISHIYNQETKAGWKEGLTSCVGIKVMVNQFQADMHQREQLFIEKDSTGQTKLVPHKPFYSSEVVLTGLELRAVRAVFADPQKALFSTSMMSEEPEFSVPSDASEPLTSPWVDLDDFVETDWAPSDLSPKIWLLPCGFCPRFTYLKRVPLKDSAHPTHPSPFGNEDSHHCLQGMEDSIHEIQIGFARKRLDELKRRYEHLKLLPNSSKPIALDRSAGSAVDNIQAVTRDVEKRIKSLTDHINQLHTLTDNASRRNGDVFGATSHPHQERYTSNGYDISSEDWSDFFNVYQVHCPRIVLSNTIRDILLDYYWYSRNRRAFEYRMATRAVRFIREQSVSDTGPESTHSAPKRSRNPTTKATERALHKILTGENQNERKRVTPSQQPNRDEPLCLDPCYGWTDEIVARRKDFVLLLRAQVILRSELNPDSNLIAVVDSATLQHIPILDSQNIDDVVHGLIMQRNYVKLTGLQVFSPNSQAPDASLQDPLVVPLEVIVDHHSDHDGFSRLLSRSNGTLQYDKFNRLRVQNGAMSHVIDGSDVSEHIRNHTDHVNICIPQFSISAKSSEFAAIYTIVTDLLLYHDPCQKKHNEALERFIYLYGFEDRNSTVDVVTNMQEHLRQLQHVAEGYELHFDGLDQDGKFELLAIKSQIYSLATELGFIFEGISRARARREDADSSETFAIRLDASSSDISWKMLDLDTALLAKLAIRGVRYSWLTRTDGSMSNEFLVDDLQGLDGSPDAVFSEMVVKYESTGAPFLLADWSSLPAVGGISIIEMFNLRLHPLRLQIERRAGRRIREYIFSRPQRDDPKEQDTMDDEKTLPRNSWEPSTPVRHDFPKGHQLLTRSSSYQNLQQRSIPESADQRPRRLRKVPSSERLRKARAAGAGTEPGAHQLQLERSSNPDVEEMRVRARQNRTFLHIQVSSLLCVLSYKRDTPLTLTTMPDLEDFKFQTPKFEYTNKIWSFEEAFNAMKKDLFREIWRQKGALLREFASRAKLVTPRKFLIEPMGTSSYGPLGSLSTARRKWRHVFQSSHSATTSRVVGPSTPLEPESTQTSPESSSVALPRALTDSHDLRDPRNSSTQLPTRGEGSHAQRPTSLRRKRSPMEVKQARA